jgi:hypothetical protein
MSNSNLALILKSLTGLVLFASWMYLDVAHVALAGDLINFIQWVLVALASHMITASAISPTTPPSVLPQPPTK